MRESFTFSKQILKVNIFNQIQLFEITLNYYENNVNLQVPRLLLFKIKGAVACWL